MSEIIWEFKLMTLPFLKDQNGKNGDPLTKNSLKVIRGEILRINQILMKQSPANGKALRHLSEEIEAASIQEAQNVLEKAIRIYDRIAA